MSTDFLPSRESLLVNWSTNFNTLIGVTPTAFGLTTALAMAYDAKHDAFVAAYAAAVDPGTRTKATVAVKNACKGALTTNARLLNRIVQGTASVTDAQKLALGLHVRDTVPSTINPPAFAPVATVVSASGRTLRMRFTDPTSPTKRAKPAGVAGIAVFSFVGPTPPADLADWTFEGNSTKSTLDVVFPDSVANWAKVWICARYFNPRLQNGPACTPVETNIPGGISAAA